MPLWIQFPRPINWVEEYGQKVWEEKKDKITQMLGPQQP